MAAAVRRCPSCATGAAGVSSGGRSTSPAAASLRTGPGGWGGRLGLLAGAGGVRQRQHGVPEPHQPPHHGLPKGTQGGAEAQAACCRRWTNATCPSTAPHACELAFATSSRSRTCVGPTGPTLCKSTHRPLWFNRCGTGTPTPLEACSTWRRLTRATASGALVPCHARRAAAPPPPAPPGGLLVGEQAAS